MKIEIIGKTLIATCRIIVLFALAMPAMATKSSEPKAFIEKTNRLPANYKGFDTKELIEMLQSRIRNLKKDEYETTDEYSRRMKKQDDEFPLNTTDLYAFRISQNPSFKYDADSQMFRSTTYKCNNLLTRGGADIRFCDIDLIIRHHYETTSQNIFGVTTTKRQFHDNFLSLAIDVESSLFEFPTATSEVHSKGKPNLDFHVPLEEARSLKNSTIAVLFVGRVTENYIIEDYGRSNAINEKPFDMIDLALPFDVVSLIFYVAQTGEILERRALNSSQK